LTSTIFLVPVTVIKYIVRLCVITIYYYVIDIYYGVIKVIKHRLAIVTFIQIFELKTNSFNLFGRIICIPVVT